MRVYFLLGELTQPEDSPLGLKHVADL